MKFTCAVCDAEHEGLPDLAFPAPFYYDTLPEAQRGPRVTLTSDLCQVNDDFFIRGSLELPIVGHEATFSYGVWLSVSERNFNRYREISGLEHPPADRYVGWISNRVPSYPDTLKLKGAAHVRPHEQRPLIELEPTDHPLSVLQREGVPLETVAKICSQALHPEA